MKRIVARIGSYEKDGQTKGEYVDVGVILKNKNDGEYVLLNPTVDLTGVLVKQGMLAQENGKKARGSVLASVFDGDRQQNNGQQSSSNDDQVPF
jgi:hypothetical protein